MLKVSPKNLIESLLLLLLNLTKVLHRRSNNRFLHLSPPFLRRQLVIDVQRKTLIRYEIQSWFDWKTGYQIFGSDSYNLESAGLEKRLKDIYNKNLERSTPVILDFGGNIGLSSLYFSIEYPEAKIYCLEIEELNFILARRNLAHRPNVTLIHAGIASAPGQGYLVDPQLGNDGYRLSSDSYGSLAAVNLLDVASLVKDHQLPQIFMVKIDIEGSEAELFSANTSWVDNTSLIIIEPHDWLMPGEETFRNFLSTISTKRRDFLIRGENIFSLSNTYN